MTQTYLTFFQVRFLKIFKHTALYTSIFSLSQKTSVKLRDTTRTKLARNLHSNVSGCSCDLASVSLISISLSSDLMSINSISKTNVEPGGIKSPNPLSPYPKYRWVIKFHNIHNTRFLSSRSYDVLNVTLHLEVKINPSSHVKLLPNITQ